MTKVEDRLRQAMTAEGERAQPGALRPLSAPDRLRGRSGARRRLTRLVPLTAAAAVSAVIAGVVVAGQATDKVTGGGNAATAPAPPPFYVTLSGTPGHAEAVIRSTHSGARLSSVPVPFAAGIGFFPWIAAGSDRTAALAVPEGSSGERFFLLRISATGRSVTLTKLPIKPPAAGVTAVTGIALSPDGQQLAVTMETGSIPRTHGVVDVVSTRTGRTRSWTGRSQYGYPFDPAWADHGTRLGFGWYNHISAGEYPSSKAQVRLLDPAAPGRDLLAARVIVSEARVRGAIQTALLTPDGHRVVASVYRVIPSGHGHGTVVVRIVTFSAATGRIIATGRRLAIPYQGGSEGSYGAEDDCQVLSLDPSGQNTLAQCRHLGRLAGDNFTAQPGTFIAPGLPTGAW
jgi:hypothetical protein